MGYSYLEQMDVSMGVSYGLFMPSIDYFIVQTLFVKTRNNQADLQSQFTLKPAQYSQRLNTIKHIHLEDYKDLVDSKELEENEIYLTIFWDCKG